MLGIKMKRFCSDYVHTFVLSDDSDSVFSPFEPLPVPLLFPLVSCVVVVCYCASVVVLCVVVVVVIGQLWGSGS